MRQRHRQYSWLLVNFFTLVVLAAKFTSCAHKSLSAPRTQERLAVVDYQLVTLSPKIPQWAEEFYALESKGNLGGRNLYWLTKGKNKQEFVVESGARVDQEVACPVARAQARELIAENLAEEMFAKVKGKPFDIFIKGKGLTFLTKELKNYLRKESVLGTYEEGRVFPGNEVMKGQKVFHCAVLVEIKNKDLNEIITKMMGLIRQDFFHLPNLDGDLNALLF